MTLSSRHGSRAELETPSLRDRCVLFLDLVRDLELEEWGQVTAVPGACGTAHREAGIGPPFLMSV